MNGGNGISAAGTVVSQGMIKSLYECMLYNILLSCMVRRFLVECLFNVIFDW